MSDLDRLAALLEGADLPWKQGDGRGIDGQTVYVKGGTRVDHVAETWDEDIASLIVEAVNSLPALVGAMRAAQGVKEGCDIENGYCHFHRETTPCPHTVLSAALAPFNQIEKEKA